jgi:DNA-binding PadR family transcriptional regulator
MAWPSLRQRVPKGLNFAVLRAIPALGINASGTQIRDYLEGKIGKEITAAKVYVALSRLEDQGLISSHVDDTKTAGRGRGRPRTIYSLKAPGLRALEAGVRLYDDPGPLGGTHEEGKHAVPASTKMG